jgi:hypothetical protein
MHFPVSHGVGPEDLLPELAGTFAYQGDIVKTVIASTLALLISSTVVPAVHADTNSSASDQQIARNVRANAARNGVSLSHVFVFSRSGAVTLIGWVPERGQIALAERSANTVDGVMSVNNLLSRGR